MTTTVAIPVQRGREWQKDRATTLPPGTPYLIAEYDEGEWAQAVNHAVGVAETDTVILSAPDVWFQTEPDSVQFLSDLAWDCDVTWGPLVRHQDGVPHEVLHEGMFCPNRLRRENYLNQVICVRKDKFLEAGGVKTGLWDLQVRMLDLGAKFKFVPEAATARDEVPVDSSPTPTRTDIAATFYHQATPGTTYWRCLLPARALPGQVIFNMPDRAADAEGKLLLPTHEGAAIFQFAGDPAHHVMSKYMMDQGIRVLLEVDDDYSRWFPQVMRKAGWKERADQCPPEGGYSVEGHRATASMVDGVIVTTERLAQQYRKLNENVFVCPNQIDPTDWPDPVKPDGKLRVGWFASASHSTDAKLIGRALEWASQQPDVEVVMIGVGATNGRPWYPFRYKVCGWSNDFGVYRKFLQEFDVGLCPVVGSPWALSRSDLKALEYGMAGAYPVCSDVPPYDTVDVPKAKTPKDFLREVQALVRDPEGARQKAKDWRAYVLAERTVERNIGRWRDAII